MTGQPPGARELIRLEDIHKTYRVGEIDVPVLKGISLTIYDGEMVALVGTSGSGKTTLMNILGCLDHPSEGRYWLDGEELSQLSDDDRAFVRSRKIGFVFQNFNLLPRTSALDNVTMPLVYTAHKLSSQDGDERGRALLHHVGLADRLEHQPTQLSGGQQQRVAIARSLVNEPALLLADEPTGNLDSRTSGEVLAMFQRINKEGVTIILVTHDADVARHANRIIRMRDGRIEDDTAAAAGNRVARTPEAAANADPTPFTPTWNGDHTSRHTRLHVLPRTLRTGLGSLRRNKLRSALTTLGIVIGVAAVIAMMEIGQGSKTAVQQTIASMGANNLLIQPGAASSGGVTFGFGSILTLTPNDADELLRQCSAISQAAPIVRARTQVVFGSHNWVPLYIYGTTPAFLEIRDWQDLEEGDAFTDRDVRNANKVCLIGQTLVRELFRGESPLGKEIRLQNVPFKIVGVLRRKGANMMGVDQDDIVLAPWTTIKYRVSAATLPNVNQSGAAQTDATQRVNTLTQLYPGTQSLYPQPSPMQMSDTPQPVRFVNVDQILVKAASTAEIPLAMSQTTDLLDERHHIRPGQPDDFNIRDMTEMTKALASTSTLMGGLLLAVALISLVVGGVGIMNIMLVSVTERTREIGIRMAVGARARNILRQFLVEAVALCLLGGVVGIGVGRGCSALVRLLLHWPTEISLIAIVSAVSVAAAVGIIFGYYPAWKAAHLDPIEALRYE